MYIDILHEAIEALWIENKVMRNELEKERELQRKERKRG